MTGDAMKILWAVGLSCAAAACAGGDRVPTAVSGDSAVVSRTEAQTTAYGSFVDEFCGRWARRNRADPAQWSELLERIRFLDPGQIGDFPFRVLGDVTLVECWTQAAEVVGLAGSEQDVERLLKHFDRLRPGEWTLQRPEDVVHVAVHQSHGRNGLALAAARFGDSHVMSGQLVQNLRECMEPSYWATPGRTPTPRQEWYQDITVAEVQRNLAYDQAAYCLDGLGNTGSALASGYLTAYQDAAQRMAEWADGFKDGKHWRFESAIERNARIRQLGLEAFIHCCAADL